MNISLGFLNKISFLYLSICLLLFFAGWLNSILIVVTCAALFFVLIKIFKDKNKSVFYLEKDYIFIIFLLCFGMAFLAGIGGYFWQNYPDWPFRNALMRDLINFQWPVIYNNGTALVYYFGFMIPAAFFGKIINFFTNNLGTAFYFANQFLLLWSALGIFLFALHLVIYSKADKIKSVICVLIFLFFSGMDVMIAGNKFSHICWHPPINYMCNFYQIIMSYHISIPIWLLTILFLQNLQKIKYYGFLLVLYLFFCPQMFLGILPFFIVNALIKFFRYIKRKRIVMFFKHIFCVENVISVLILVPILYLFFMSNYTSSHSQFYLLEFNKHAYTCIIYDVGIYLFLIMFKYYRDINYYILVLTLIFLPFLAFKTNYDFGMRVVAPALTILMAYITKLLFSNHTKIVKYAISIVLLIGFITPLNIILISYHNSLGNHILVHDDIVSFNNKIKPINRKSDMSYDYKNYGSINLDNYVFWKYLAKRRTKQ